MATSQKKDDSKSNESTAPEKVETDSSGASTQSSQTDVRSAGGGKETVQAHDHEVDLRGARDEAGLNQLAGHQAHIYEWANSEAGKQFISNADKTFKEREQAVEEAQVKALDKDGLTEAEKKYQETVEN